MRKNLCAGLDRDLLGVLEVLTLLYSLNDRIELVAKED